MSNTLDPRLRRLFSELKLLVLDVDGVLTDGGMYYGESGEMFKKFNTRDGMGIERLRQAGVKVAIMSGEDSQSIVQRFQKVKVDEVHVGIKDKGRLIVDVMERLGVTPRATGYLGDDVNDLPALEQVGLPMAVADAFLQVREGALYVTQRNGGQGAVREVCELILTYQGGA
jgi:3-deoxy-D-manno-octulosonate 8-phosphate phosphatase (KDO 8-P phosphatase)